MANIKTPKNPKEFVCESCDFKSSNKKDFNRHLVTEKHTKLTDTNKKTQLEKEKKYLKNKSYYCECGNIYKHSSSLSKHKKFCCNNVELTIKEKEDNELVIKEEESKSNDIALIIRDELTTIVKQQIEGNIKTQKQNQDFQKQSLEFQQQMFNQIIELMKSSLTTNNNIVNGNVNNNNYTQFNLQLYLNETCKNAMTINQFLDYLEPTVEELEATAHLGYVEGISRIIMRGFKNLEEYELPFHCTDLKREHIYIKNPDDEWIEETDEKPLLLRFIKEVAKKSFKNLSAWQKKNPNWANYNSKQNDLFNKIVGNSVSGATEEEQQANYEKIMKNIMKNITIDKSKKNK